MFCASKTYALVLIESETALRPAHGHKLRASETVSTDDDGQSAPRFIPDAEHTIPEHVWGDEGPTTN